MKALRLLGIGFLSGGLGVVLVWASVQSYLYYCYLSSSFMCDWGPSVGAWVGLALVLAGPVLLVWGVVEGNRKGWAW